jgi:hypothetical protein
VHQCRSVDLRQGGKRVAGRHRVGGVRLHQDCRPLAALQPAAEIGRNVNQEQHVTPADQRLGVFGTVGPGDDAKIGRVLESAHDRPRMTAVGSARGSALMA